MISGLNIKLFYPRNANARPLCGSGALDRAGRVDDASASGSAREVRDPEVDEVLEDFISRGTQQELGDGAVEGHGEDLDDPHHGVVGDSVRDETRGTDDLRVGVVELLGVGLVALELLLVVGAGREEQLLVPVELVTPTVKDTAEVLLAHELDDLSRVPAGGVHLGHAAPQVSPVVAGRHGLRHLGHHTFHAWHCGQKLL